MYSEIKPKSCTYGCGVEIYWNTQEDTYFELHSGNKHVCPNLTIKKSSTITQPPTYATKPKYYNNNNYKKSDSSSTKNQQQQQSKPKMDNSFELFTGSPESIKKQYEYLSDMIRDSGGKVHGSQSHIIAGNNTLQLIVYYEVPAENQNREEVKRKFENFVRNQVHL
jgi:hypothetical protein